MINLTKVKITGRVQGVFFRDYTKRTALNLSLKGIVRNLPDGSVEAVVLGEEEKIEQFIQWCWRGSPMSNVVSVITTKQENRSHFSSFEIDY